jgi:ELWxxDGT repeat protein
MGHAGRAILLLACLHAFGIRLALAQSVFEVEDIFPGGSSTPTDLMTVNGALQQSPTLYFVADDGTAGAEVWRSDGTPGGTALVQDVDAGSASSAPGGLTRVSGVPFATGQLFFAATDPTDGRELWKRDGSGATLVKNIRAGSASSDPSNLTAAAGAFPSAGTLYFTADDGVNGVELWKSDGTTAGTVLVKDIVPGPDPSSPANLYAIGSTLYFTADTSGVGRELWKSDGTSPGTVLLKDILAGPASGSPGDVAALGSVLFFRARDADHGLELSRSDGRPGGTFLVHDIVPGPVDSGPQYITAAFPFVFFAATTGYTRRELWATDLLFKAEFD